jgi:hypothetical protein
MKTLFILLFLTISFINISSNEAKYISLYKESIVRAEMPLTMENVIIELIRNDVKCIDEVVRQIILETGHLKSRRAVQDHNLFGFEVKKGLIFHTWQESVKYYKKWQDKRYKGGEYYSFLTKIGYAQDIEYIKKLQSLSTKKFNKLYS